MTSPALSRIGIYAVGNPAPRFPKNEEPGSSKATSDQAVILLLTSLELDAAQHDHFPRKGNILEAKYALSTGLPLTEVKHMGAKATFRNRLMDKVHEVEFLQTPQLAGTVVRIELDSMDVYGEGQAAMMHLVTEGPCTRRVDRQ